MPGNGKAALCFRVGYLQRGDNQPGTHMGWGGWGQAMWQSNRDLCQAMERSVMAEGIGFAVLNLMSDNPGMRWDIATTKRTIGYAPQDGAAPVLTETIEQDERTRYCRRPQPTTTAFEAQFDPSRTLARALSKNDQSWP